MKVRDAHGRFASNKRTIGPHGWIVDDNPPDMIAVDLVANGQRPPGSVPLTLLEARLVVVELIRQGHKVVRGSEDTRRGGYTDLTVSELFAARTTMEHRKAVDFVRRVRRDIENGKLHSRA